MGISRDTRERWRDRDLLAEIKQENANRLNELLYIRDNETNRKLTNNNNRYESTSK